MKKIAVLCLAAAMLVLTTRVNADYPAPEISVYLNGERLQFDAPPQIIDGRTMVPAQIIFEALGLDVPAEANHTFVPIRAVSENAGADVSWCGDTHTVNIKTADFSDSPVVNLPVTNSFEAELFAAMPTDENYMISPFSLRMALAMAANGASGVTQAEILAALRIDDLNAFNQAAAEFIARESDAVEFNVANSIWFNQDLFGCEVLDFSETYKRIIADYFAGAAQRINAEDGADIINAWISEQTQNRINDVIAEDVFTCEESETLAVLVNAIYFKGGWASTFLPGFTQDDIFTDRNGVQSTIPFMEQTSWFDFYEDDYFMMMAKPYEDEDIRMYLVLPNEGARLTFDMFEEAISEMRRAEVRLRLPQFTTEFLHENLVDILEDMGIQRAFERETHFDFVGYTNMMYPPYVFGLPLYVWIGDVLQKTFIAVDEEGTEAAAATVVYMFGVPMSLPPYPPIPFYCDRPFIYFIRNDATGDILFMGEFAFAE